MAFLLGVLLPAQAWFAITLGTHGVAHHHVHGSVHGHEHDGVQRHYHAADVQLVAVDAGELRLHASLTSSERYRDGSMAAIVLVAAGLSGSVPAQSVRPGFGIPSQAPGWLFAYRLDRPPKRSRMIRAIA